MTVVIFEGAQAPEGERQEAENLANLIEDKSKHKTKVTSVSLSFDPSAFDGVVVVGGQIANLAYSNLVDRNFVQKVTQGNTETLKVGNVEGTPTMAVAAWSKGGTKKLVDKAIIQDDVDKFIGMLPQKEDDEESKDPITDPNDPLLPDPDPVKTPHELRVRPPPAKEAVILADYKIEFTDVVKEKSDLENKDAAVGSAASGSIGASLGTDEDIYQFAGKIEDVNSDRNIVLIINGEEYQYDSDSDKIGKPSDLLGQIGGTEESDRIQDSKRKKSKDGKGDGKKSLMDKIADNALLIGGGLLLLLVLTGGSSGTVVVRGK